MIYKEINGVKGGKTMSEETKWTLNVQVIGEPKIPAFLTRTVEDYIKIEAILEKRGLPMPIMLKYPITYAMRRKTYA